MTIIDEEIFQSLKYKNEPILQLLQNHIPSTPSVTHTYTHTHTHTHTHKLPISH